MSFAQTSTGTTTPTVGVETTLIDSTVNGTHVLAVRASNLVNGERLELRAYVKVLTGDTFGATTLYRMWSVGDALSEPVILSIPIASRYGLRFTLTQVGGTARAFPWEVWTV